jgi:urea transporter
MGVHGFLTTWGIPDYSGPFFFLTWILLVDTFGNVL